jgi:hypothetical protein
MPQQVMSKWAGIRGYGTGIGMVAIIAAVGAGFWYLANDQYLEPAATIQETTVQSEPPDQRAAQELPRSEPDPILPAPPVNSPKQDDKRPEQSTVPWQSIVANVFVGRQAVMEVAEQQTAAEASFQQASVQSDIPSQLTENPSTEDSADQSDVTEAEDDKVTNHDESAEIPIAEDEDRDDEGIDAGAEQDDAPANDLGIDQVVQDAVAAIELKVSIDDEDIASVLSELTGDAEAETDGSGRGDSEHGKGHAKHDGDDSGHGSSSSRDEDDNSDSDEGESD